MDSKQEAIKILRNLYNVQRLDTLTQEEMTAVAMAIKALDQQEKTAAWVPTDEEPHEIYECNACGWLLYDEDRTDFKYCPNCGIKMIESQESEVSE